MGLGVVGSEGHVAIFPWQGLRSMILTISRVLTIVFKQWIGVNQETPYMFEQETTNMIHVIQEHVIPQYESSQFSGFGSQRLLSGGIIKEINTKKLTEGCYQS